MTTIQATFMVSCFLLVPASALLMIPELPGDPLAPALPGRRGRRIFAVVVGVFGVALVIVSALVRV